MSVKQLIYCLQAVAISVTILACDTPNRTTDCGNAKIDEGEVCDGTNLDGQTCADLTGFTAGTLACNEDCTDYDTSRCTSCGNAEIDEGEVCDGTNLDGQTCADLTGFTAGTLACNEDCTGYDTSGCTSSSCNPTDVTSSVGSFVMVDTTSESDDYTPSCAFRPEAPDALLSFVAPNSANYVIDTRYAETDFDTLLWAFTDCQDPTGTEISCHDENYENCVGLMATIMVPATAGETIYFVVDGAMRSGGIAKVSITEFNCTDDSFEDNDTVATAAPLTGTFPLNVPGVLCPDDLRSGFGNVIDFYTVTVPASEVLNAAITGGTLTDCDQLDVYFQIWDQDRTTLLAESFGYDGNCPQALQVPGLPDMATTLLVVVGESEFDDPYFIPRDYNLTLTTQHIECGDGIVDVGEECDDGNDVAHDGCENDCTFSVPCFVPADQDLGTLIHGETVNTVTDLTVQTQNYPLLSCIFEIPEFLMVEMVDFMYSFNIPTEGTLLVDSSDDSGMSIMSLLANDGSCSEIDCFSSGILVSYHLTPGEYRFVLQSIADETTGGDADPVVVNFTFHER